MPLHASTLRDAYEFITSPKMDGLGVSLGSPWFPKLWSKAFTSCHVATSLEMMVRIEVALHKWLWPWGVSMAMGVSNSWLVDFMGNPRKNDLDDDWRYPYDSGKPHMLMNHDNLSRRDYYYCPDVELTGLSIAISV